MFVCLRRRAGQSSSKFHACVFPSQREHTDESLPSDTSSHSGMILWLIVHVLRRQQQRRNTLFNQSRRNTIMSVDAPPTISATVRVNWGQARKSRRWSISYVAALSLAQCALSVLLNRFNSNLNIKFMHFSLCLISSIDRAIQKAARATASVPMYRRRTLSWLASVPIDSKLPSDDPTSLVIFSFIFMTASSMNKSWWF